MNILPDFKDITTFIFDVDGVLTNGSLILLSDGQMARTMNIKDGYALQLAIKKGYHVIVISGGSSEAVKMRLEKLGVTDVFMAVTDKRKQLEQYFIEKNLSWNRSLYMGDDIPDLSSMKLTAMPCCPADAATEIKKISKYISYLNGGSGCVREVIEKVLLLNNDWNEDVQIAAI